MQSHFLQGYCETHTLLKFDNKIIIVQGMYLWLLTCIWEPFFRRIFVNKSCRKGKWSGIQTPNLTFLLNNTYTIKLVIEKSYILTKTNFNQINKNLINVFKSMFFNWQLILILKSLFYNVALIHGVTQTARINIIYRYMCVRCVFVCMCCVCVGVLSLVSD